VLLDRCIAGFENADTAAVERRCAPTPRSRWSAPRTWFGVLTVTDAGIARLLVFGGGPDRVAQFGLPFVHREAEASPFTYR
jgi:hypothetical protein